MPAFPLSNKPCATNLIAQQSVAARAGNHHLPTLIVGALCALPFLVPVHVLPVPSFHAEWLSGVIGLLLIIVCNRVWADSRIELPAVAIIPALLLTATVLQQLSGLAFFVQQGLIACAYLLLALGLMVSGSTLRRSLGTERLVRAMAGGFLIGALLQCVVCAYQFHGDAISGWTSPLLTGRGLYGNLAQQNHLTHYLWLAVISALWLRMRSFIHGWTFVGAVACLTLASAYTGSRSALLYPLALLGVSVLIRKRWQDEIMRTLSLRLVTLTTFIALALLFLPGLLPIATGGDSAPSDGLGRLVAAAVEPASASVRITLLTSAGQSVLAAPWFGHGIGSVPLQSLLHGPEMAEAAFGVAEHFHNLPANWAVEYGVIVSIAGLVLLTMWFVRVWRLRWTAEHFWAVSILLIAGLHSLLEYPLWYSFFLAPVALILGAFDPVFRVITISRLSKVAMGLGLMAAILLLFNLWNDHQSLARIYRGTPSGPDAEKIWGQQVDELLRLRRESLFSPHINGMLIVTSDINREHLANKLHICNAALHFSPAPLVIFKCAAFHLLDGQTDAGLELARQGQRSFPEGARQLANEWRDLFASQAELAPLLRILAGENGRAPTGVSAR